MSLTVKRGDTYAVRWLVRDRDTGLPMDLTGFAAALHVKPVKGGSVSVLTATIPSPATDGIVRHVLTGTLTPGDYDLQIELTKASDRITVPTSGNTRLHVDRDLA